MELKTEKIKQVERVDIFFTPDLDFSALNFNEKGHLTRYRFASSIVSPGSAVADFSCGTGYGSVLLAQVADHVVGVDINKRVIRKIKNRYKNISNVEFICSDILDLEYKNAFDFIISFETIEHLSESKIPKLFDVFAKALKPGGTLIFSTPYMQAGPVPDVKSAHLTYYIDEARILDWLSQSGFEHVVFKAQYLFLIPERILDHTEQKDIIICVAKKAWKKH